MDTNIFVARHPIFNKFNKVVAYEILYRDGSKNSFTQIDGDKASRSVINKVLLDFGVEKINNNKPLFINFTENLLFDNNILILPKKQIIIEILETCEPSDILLERIKFLHKNGFTLALDDYIYKKEWDKFLDFIDYVKVDFSLAKGDQRKKIVTNLKKHKLKIIAEKVESYDDFHEAKLLEYDYFQGYYYCKPSIITTQKISENKLNYLQILQEINKSDMRFDILESYIKRDLSLTYKLLKFLNSSYFGLPNKISSVKSALTLLGQDELIKWISLIAMDSLVDQKPLELVRVSLSRALFCEAISNALNKKNEHESYFLMGMLSLIDAILDKTKEEALNEININKTLLDTLLGEETEMSPYLDLTIALESNDFETISSLKEIINIPLEQVMELYLNAISVADALINLI